MMIAEFSVAYPDRPVFFMAARLIFSANILTISTGLHCGERVETRYR